MIKRKIQINEAALAWKDTETKICGACKEEKTLSEFRTRVPGEPVGPKSKGRRSNCIPCQREIDIWRATIKNYGLTKTEYMKLLINQNYCCDICGVHNDEFVKKKRYSAGDKLYVDHCHKSGKVRGLLCRDCNMMLGNARDIVENLEAGIAYLKKHQNDQ